MFQCSLDNLNCKIITCKTVIIILLFNTYNKRKIKNTGTQIGYTGTETNTIQWNLNAIIISMTISKVETVQLM